MNVQRLCARCGVVMTGDGDVCLPCRKAEGGGPRWESKIDDRKAEPLTRGELGQFACRCVAILLFAVAMMQLPLLFAQVWSEIAIVERSGFWSFVGSPFVLSVASYFWFAWMLWVFAPSIGRQMLSQPSTPIAGTSFDRAAGIETVAFRVVGLVLFLKGVQLMAEFLYGVIMSDSDPAFSPILFPIEAVVALVMGGWIMIGMPGILRLLARIRGGSKERVKEGLPSR